MLACMITGLLVIWSYMALPTLAQVLVQEVGVGDIAVLPCPSNDDNHRFQFWQLTGNEVIGPGNTINREKYKYEVLSGTLYIRGVSSAESGFYRCVSKSLHDPAYNIKSVELVVRKDWEDVYENDYETNMFRALVAVAVLLAIVVICVVLYVLWRKKQSNRFRGMLDEESPDESPVGCSYSVQSLPGMNSTPKSHIQQQGIDNPALDTELPKPVNSLHTDSQL
ncbi:uncharacterized protein LOC124805167 [Schistocerca piceifrons]|uniref:uncharacterized protein LOC124805167 n=1 Tax=Schistocerca piceifrons TaxID=274613 RepID=UPI001F5FD739|nr:uncharacterized protein LOC124805167 [Schistocerca piceifrons]